MKTNWLAVIVAAIAHFIVGGLWYGLIFGNKFLELIAWTPEQIKQMESRNPAKPLVLAFLTAVILVYVLAHFIQYVKAKTPLEGIQTAFWLWLGFVATTQLSTVIFEQRHVGLYLLNIGYQLVACSIAGVILAVWRPREAKETAAQPA